jgi:hypothetical protein
MAEQNKRRGRRTVSNRLFQDETHDIDTSTEKTVNELFDTFIKSTKSSFSATSTF